MSLTQQQQAAAFAPGDVAVLAGAGSGKTHMLVARYLHLLKQYSPLEVPAVTFTEAGAAELRARVRQEVLRQRPGDVETLAELEAAQISTIHALCGRIVRDHPQAAGVRPDAAVMDEREARLWMSQRFRMTLGRLPHRLFRHLPFSQMSAALQALLRDPLLAEQALQVGAENWGTWTAQAQEEARLTLVRRDDFQKAVADLRAYQGESADRMEQARQTALRFATVLEAGDHSGISVAEAVTGLCSIKLVGGSAKQWPQGGLDTVKAALKALRERAEDAKGAGVLTLTVGEADDWLMLALPDLKEAFTLVRAHLTDLKRRAGLMDFSDLEVCALRALRDPQVVAHYAERWKAMLIDEAQDNNPVQAELLDILCCGAQRTMVGDLKQSIYGFRRAAPDLFQATSDRIAAQGGQQITLDLSFRTHRGLIDATNRVFSQLLGKLHTPLQGVRPGPEHVTLRAWQLEELKPKARARKAEAAVIAAQIQTLLQEGYPVHDKASGGERPLRPGDVAVLSRGWAALEPVRRALQDVGLPVQDLSVGSLLDTPEARDALAILTAVALQDPVALVTVLRSPFLAVRDAVIHELAQAAAAGGWFEALRHSQHPELAPARQLFGELLRLRRHTRPSDLLLLADRLSGYTAVIANLWDAERRLADWQGFLDLVRDVERGEDELFSVTRALQTYLAEGVEVPRPALADRDAITLTTMHSSKGLEWPVVVIADLNWAAPVQTPDVLMDAGFGVALRGPFDAPPALHTLIASKRQSAEEAETRRLLYVALTRARDHLILTANGPGKRGSLLTLLTPALSAAEVSVELRPAPPLPEAVADLPALPVPPVPSEYWTEPLSRVNVSSTVSATLPMEPLATPASDWEETLDYLDPLWVDWATRLAAQGIPAPAEVHYDICVNGRVSGKTALMLWKRPKQDVILMEAESPVTGHLTVSLADDPAVVATRLRELLVAP